MLASTWPLRADEPQEVENEGDGSFGVTSLIACKEIKGYEDFVAFPDPVLTKDDKLLVYFRPRNFKTARNGALFASHLTQDCRIRKKGGKPVIWSKKNITDYAAKSDSPRPSVYLRNTIALKSLRPGVYVFEIVLRDEIGRSAPAYGSLPFRIVASLHGGGAVKQDEPVNPGPP